MDWKDEHGPKVKELIKSLIPDDAHILVLSFTGSRMFGWGGEHYDIDVRGIVGAKNWWSDAHHGERLYDVTIENLLHAMRRASSYWTFFEDISNPFYIHPDFEYDEMMTFCTAQNVKNHMGTIRYQRAQLNTYQAVRTALHTYRLLMTPLYFLKEGKINVNMLEVNKEPEFGFKQLEWLKDVYLHRISRPLDWPEIYRTLDELQVRLEGVLEDRTDTIDSERFEAWNARLLERFAS